MLLSHTVTSALGLLQQGCPVLFVQPQILENVYVRKGILKTSSGDRAFLFYKQTKNVYFLSKNSETDFTLTQYLA